MRDDPDVWREELEERAAWEATLGEELEERAAWEATLGDGLAEE